MLTPITDGAKASQARIEVTEMVRPVLYFLVMAALIVGIDIAFFRNRFWERLIVNIAIVLMFAVFYLMRFLRHP